MNDKGNKAKQAFQIQESLLQRWEGNILAGNKCMSENNFRGASQQYELARQYAIKIYTSQGQCRKAISALVVTYHNIAGMHCKQHNKSLALHYLESIHQIILTALMPSTVSSHKYKALLQASQSTYATLLKFKQTGVYQ